MAKFFSSLMRQTSFHRQKSNASTDAPDETDGKDFFQDDDTIEDEGFVLVGQTPSEKRGADSIPCKMSSSRLPSCNQTMMSQCAFQQSPSSLFNSRPKPTSPVSDVPFKFHPSLDTEMQIKEMFQGINLETQQFDWGKYSHDFTNEKLCLRDLSCGEEANIDEFVLSNSGVTVPRTAEENLIVL